MESLAHITLERNLNWSVVKKSYNMSLWKFILLEQKPIIDHYKITVSKMLTELETLRDHL